MNMTNNKLMMNDYVSGSAHEPSPRVAESQSRTPSASDSRRVRGKRRPESKECAECFNNYTKWQTREVLSELSFRTENITELLNHSRSIYDLL